MTLSLRYILLTLLLMVLGRLTGQSDLRSYDVEMILPDQFAQYTYMSGIAEDPDGYIWLASYKGLTCYDGHKLVHYNNRYKTGSIFQSKEGNGYLTLVTNDNGLHLWTIENETKNIVVFNTKDRRIVKTYPSIDSSSTYLFTAINEIFTIDEVGNDLEVSSPTGHNMDTLTIQNQEVHLVSNNTPTDQKVFTKTMIIGVDDDGNITSDSIDKHEYTNLTDSLKAVYDLSPTVKYHTTFENKVWVTNRLKTVGLWYTKNKVWEDYTSTINDMVQSTNPNALRGDIISIIESKNDAYFVLYANSLIKLSPKLPKEEEFLESISSGKSYVSMRQITEDSDGNIYASYYTGVAVKPTGSDKFSNFRGTKNAPKEKEATYSLTYYDGRLIWNSTIFDLEGDADSYIEYPHYGQHINHYLEHDTLWLFSWFSNGWIKYEFSSGTSSVISKIERNDFSVISDITQDLEGNFWATTDRAGLIKYDRSGQILKDYTFTQLGLKYEDDYLYGIHWEGDKVYFGTQKGLGVLNAQTGEVITIRIPYSSVDGQLLERKVYTILPDGKGIYYLGTNYGLVSFDSETMAVKTLINGHPLADKEYNRNSAYKARDGRFYLGTIDGLYSFLPDELIFEQEEYSLPLPKIHNLQIYNKKTQEKRDIISGWDEQEEITLLPSDQNFKLEFSSPSEHEVYYAYRIKGLQEEWSSLALDGIIEIYALPVGTFEIEMKAQNSPLQAKAAIRNLTLIKPQYWYLRWWAKLIYALSIIAFVASLVRYRYKKQLDRAKQMQRLRTKISSDLHDDVGSLLGGLAIQSDLMSSVVPTTFKPKLEEISATSREAMDLMRDIVWALDSRKDKYENLIDRMRVFAEITLGRRKIDYSFDVSQITGTTAIRPEVRQNVYLIFKEAIINIAKHSACDKVDITFAKTPTQYLLLIKDNGVINPNKLSTDGQGLTNMKMRAQRIGGSIDFSKENGFAVSLRF